MARNKQTTPTSHADPKASTTDRRFDFRDTHSDPKFHCRIHFRSHNYNYDTSEHPDVFNDVSEPGGAETSTNGGRYPILISPDS